jgi:NADH-quinone oxidoreductase subunit C
MADRKDQVMELQTALTQECGSAIIENTVELGDLIIKVAPKDLLAVLTACKQSQALAFNLLVDITAVDWMDSRPERFEVVYQLLSISKLWRVTIKAAVSEANPEVTSATALWNGANFLEREVWDMFGIRFAGHPDLRRILMYEEFVGHPLRKDYPVQGKQPRIPLRAPEVENTARLMHRPDLVTIRPKQRSRSEQTQGARE